MNYHPQPGRWPRGSPPGGRYRGARGRGVHTYPEKRAPRVIPPALGPHLSSLKVIDLDANVCPPSQAKITDPTVISAYNLMGRHSTSIIVPGAPPRYTPPFRPAKLVDDVGGEYLRDENAARFPDHPMEPAVQSILASHPEYDTSAVDVFACGSTMGNLVRFVHAKSHPFCFVVHMVGNTAFLLRREHSPTMLIDGVVGFGHSFPEAYTTWDADVKGSSSHQRVLEYKFGGLKFLVRFESDGYLGDEEPLSGGAKKQSDPAPLADAMAGLLKEDGAPGDPHPRVEARGHLIGQSSVFDLKTRSIRKVDDDVLAEELPRLWVRQISKFILAFHRSGVFEDIRVQDVAVKVQEWEAGSTSTLTKLSAVIRKIIATAQQLPSQKLEIRGTDEGTLEVHAVGDQGWDALPQRLMAMWTADADEEADTDLGSESPSRGHSTDGDEDDEDARSMDYTACSADDCGYCGRCSY